MISLRLPIDDPRQGLAERPEPFHASADMSLVGGALLDGDATTPGFTDLEREAMAEQFETACRYGAAIERVAARHGLLPSIIAGFCSRRSGWGQELSPNGVEGTRDVRPRMTEVEGRSSPMPPDGLGFVRGLMGLDFDRHLLARKEGWRRSREQYRGSVLSDRELPHRASKADHPSGNRPASGIAHRF